MTTKYSSPRKTRMAKCPSTMRALSLSKRAAIAVVNRPADRDQAQDGPSLGVGPGRPDIDCLLAIEPQRNDDLPAAARGIGVVARLLDEFDDQPGHVGIGRLGCFIGLERVAGRLGIRLQAIPAADRRSRKSAPTSGWPACTARKRSSP